MTGGVSIQLPIEKQQELKKICRGKFTFVVIGPSQHGKTTFLTQVVGINDLEDARSEKYAIGTGQGSITKDMHIWEQVSYSTQISVQFVDTPGLSDSRASEGADPNNTDEAIKKRILTFLASNNPQCVLLFHKLSAEITAVSIYLSPLWIQKLWQLYCQMELIPHEHLMETIQKAIGESLLIISMEHAKNAEIKRLAELKLRNSILGCIGGLTVIGVAEAAATGLVLGTPIVGLPIAGLVCLGVWLANRK